MPVLLQLIIMIQSLSVVAMTMTSNPPVDLCCGVCTLPFREPQLLGCSRQKICESCIDRIFLQGRSCPYCSQVIRTRLDEELRSRVLDLAVYCSVCTWFGEVRNMQHHISKDCEFEKHQCRYHCGENFCRIDLVITSNTSVVIAR